jgi:hypothetical protein
VFHVLAHVDVGAVPASCHDAAYIAWAAARLGPATERALAEDARVLAATLASHDALARAQLLAWLWREESHVREAAVCELRELRDVDVADPAALVRVQGLGAPVEVLRAAAELELPRLKALDAAPVERGARALTDALAEIARAAPWLLRMELATVRALPRRGRVHHASIFVGAPGVAGAELHHVAWQAAHEATVSEVERSPRGLAGPPPTFEAVERAALGLLRSRARRAGLADTHARWLSTLDLGALGPIPDVEDGAE